MFFFSLLLVLFLMRVWPSWRRFQAEGWYHAWDDITASMTTRSEVHYLVSVLIPVFAVLVLRAFLDSADHFLTGVLDLLLCMLVLMYSLGRGESEKPLATYVYALEQLGDEPLQPAIAALDDDFSPEPGSGMPLQHVQARSALVYGWFTRVFVVVFWFALLGPAAALLYRLTVQFSRKRAVPLSANVRDVMEWPAARLLSIVFFLMGDFAAGVKSLASTLFDPGMTHRGVLLANALASLNLTLQWLDERFIGNYSALEQATMAGQEIQLLQELMKRSLVFCVVVVAIFQIVG